MLIILSTDLEINIDHRTFTIGDAVLSEGTFLLSDKITDDELQKNKKKRLKLLAFNCKIISLVSLSIQNRPFCTKLILKYFTKSLFVAT